MVLRVIVPELRGATPALYHSPCFEGRGGGEDGKGVATCTVPGNSYFKNNPKLSALRVKQNIPRFEAQNSL